MKVALAQLNYTVGAIKNNKFKIIKAIHNARQEGADLILFSEHAISGTNCYDLINKVRFLESCEVALMEIASHCDNITAVVGIPVMCGYEKISCAAIIQNRHVVKFVGKNNVASRNDKLFFSGGDGKDFIKVAGKKISVIVGEDILERNVGETPDFVVSVGADSYYRGRIIQRYEFYKDLAYEVNKPIFAVNHLGGQSETIYDGSSSAYNEKGEGIAFLANFEEDFVIVDTDNAPPVSEPPQDIVANIYDAIRLGIRDYFEKNGFTKACLGLSGGIDSAVVLALVAEVLGPGNVRVLMMPSEYSTDHSLNDAIEMAHNLGVDYDVIPITEPYHAMLESLKPIIGGTKFDVTEENMQARVRCDMLMSLSNKFGYILLNTSNKSEASMGYGTLYGDLSGSISVIGDLYKTEVYQLARFINRRMTIIPQNIIDKEPSAELRHDQKDSDNLPPYEVLDAILFRFLEELQDADEIVNAGFDDDIVAFVMDKIRAYEYKRRQCPPALRLSKRPYNSGFILPLINKYNLYPHEITPEPDGELPQG